MRAGRILAPRLVPPLIEAYEAGDPVGISCRGPRSAYAAGRLGIEMRGFLEELPGEVNAVT